MVFLLPVPSFPLFLIFLPRKASLVFLPENHLYFSFFWNLFGLFQFPGQTSLCGVFVFLPVLPAFPLPLFGVFPLLSALPVFWQPPDKEPW